MEKNKVKPISPKEVTHMIPDFIFEAVNQLIKEKWLDIEDHYRKAGWKVTYDKPAYCENYDAYFKFEMA